jgi:hypothetical protein
VRQRIDIDAVEPKWRRWVSPNLPVGAALVAVAVPAEVEAGTRAQLEHAQRQLGRAGDSQEAEEQRRASTDLVGLHTVGQ